LDEEWQVCIAERGGDQKFWKIRKENNAPEDFSVNNDGEDDSLLDPNNWRIGWFSLPPETVSLVQNAVTEIPQFEANAEIEKEIQNPIPTVNGISTSMLSNYTFGGEHMTISCDPENMYLNQDMQKTLRIARFNRVQEELASKGVTEDSLDESPEVIAGNDWKGVEYDFYPTNNLIGRKVKNNQQNISKKRSNVISN
jgi:hypothetical protein